MLPKLNDPAPEFKGIAVFDHEFKEISLSDYKGKYLLLIFYPSDFTFICPSELTGFSDRISEFRAKNCDLIGCSTDSEYAHYAWMNTPKRNAGIAEIGFPLLSDKSMKISKAYGVLNEETGISFRGMFLIDSQQNLRQITMNNMVMPRSVDDALRLISECQYVDDMGGGCPANWKPIGKNLNVDVKTAGNLAIGVN